MAYYYLAAAGAGVLSAANANTDLVLNILNPLIIFILFKYNIWNKIYLILWYIHDPLLHFYLFINGKSFLILGISTSLIYRVLLFLFKFALEQFLFKCLDPGDLNFNLLALLGPTILTLFKSPLWLPILYNLFCDRILFFQLDDEDFVLHLAYPGILLNSFANPKNY